MNQGTAPDSAMWSLRSRGPAHAMSHRCLEAQNAARPRNIITRAAGADPLHPDAVPWYQRALAELRVGRLLDELGPEYRVLHAVPDGKGDEHIDHLVIGPPGVFAITTARHPGGRVRVEGPVLLIDGQRTGYIATAEREAQTAARSLGRAVGNPVPVTPLVVVVDAREIRNGDGGLELVVLSAARLVAQLWSRPVELGPDVVASISRAAEEWTTWRPLTAELGAPTDPEPRFTRLRREVDGARRIRILWFVGSVAALTIVAFGAASGLFS